MRILLNQIHFPYSHIPRIKSESRSQLLKNQHAYLVVLEALLKDKNFFDEVCRTN
jgi:hypothetical protein